MKHITFCITISLACILNLVGCGNSAASNKPSTPNTPPLTATIASSNLYALSPQVDSIDSPTRHTTLTITYANSEPKVSSNDPDEIKIIKQGNIAKNSFMSLFSNNNKVLYDVTYTPDANKNPNENPTATITVTSDDVSAKINLAINLNRVTYKKTRKFYVAANNSTSNIYKMSDDGNSFTSVSPKNNDIPQGMEYIFGNDKNIIGAYETQGSVLYLLDKNHTSSQKQSLTSSDKILATDATTEATDTNSNKMKNAIIILIKDSAHFGNNYNLKLYQEGVTKSYQIKFLDNVSFDQSSFKMIATPNDLHTGYNLIIKATGKASFIHNIYIYTAEITNNSGNATITSLSTHPQTIAPYKVLKNNLTTIKITNGEAISAKKSFLATLQPYTSGSGYNNMTLNYNKKQFEVKLNSKPNSPFISAASIDEISCSDTYDTSDSPPKTCYLYGTVKYNTKNQFCVVELDIAQNKSAQENTYTGTIKTPEAINIGPSTTEITGENINPNTKVFMLLDKNKGKTEIRKFNLSDDPNKQPVLNLGENNTVPYELYSI